jgi:hypothetical protein
MTIWNLSYPPRFILFILTAKEVYSGYVAFFDTDPQWAFTIKKGE